MAETTGIPRARDEATELARAMSGYRRAREQIERGILSLATSVDGHSFEVQASLHHLRLRRGGYLALEDAEGRRLGQLTHLGTESTTTGAVAASAASGILVRLAKGHGVVLDGDGLPFHDATARPAEPDEVAGWLERTRPARSGLEVGELVCAPGVPAVLDSGGLGRHTFMCGQSGSGKTYSLGLLLERVLSETSLRVVVLDPNSDYVGLGEVRRGADPALAEQYAAVTGDVAVWSNAGWADRALRLRFADLDKVTQAAVLGLDPVADADEYSALLELLELQQKGRPIITDAAELVHATDPGARRLGMRARNLGVLDWSIWSPELPSLVDELRSPTSRCVVVDLGSLGTVQEQRVVAETVLSTLWDCRADRTPCLVVVDEAHNICAADPEDAVSRLSTDRAIQIAAEGRKYGLYLLTSTQRPQKVHENIVSQCDNLLLMRMNSLGDIGRLQRIFSFVPPGLIEDATSFAMGQALVAGKVLPQPAYVRMGERVSREGGADVPATWASRPSRS